MDKVSGLLKDAIDLHIHSGPTLLPRSLDHTQAAGFAIEAGMKAIVLKDHHFITTHQGYFLKKYIFKNSPLNIFGGLVLNNAVGGLNPHAVDSAIKSGAKIIWMPTISAQNHIAFMKNQTRGFLAQHKKNDLAELPLTILNDQHKLRPEVIQICQLIGKADIILATGHLGIKEIEVLVAEALRQGVKKILVNHPEHLINASIADMKGLARRGAFLEHCYSLVMSKRITKEYLAEMIRAVGAEQTILVSDLGQIGRVYPVQGLRNCIHDMLEQGIQDEEIDRMLRTNPAKLLNLN